MESMMPWEMDFYVSMVREHVAKLAEARESQ